MTFGEKLKEARKKTGLSQEQFAEKMNISRSAVAKWENDIGIPDVSNIKSIARLFNVSIDSLLDVETDNNTNSCTNNFDIVDVNTEITNEVQSCPEYEEHFYTIELTGWNDGVSDAMILGQDDKFVYYKIIDKKQSFYGMIGKKYIKSITEGKEIKEITEKEVIDRAFFCDKHVKMEVAHKEGIIKGFFDFKNDNYLDVVIKKFVDKKILLAFGNELYIDLITKIEEIREN